MSDTSACKESGAQTCSLVLGLRILFGLKKFLTVHNCAVSGQSAQAVQWKKTMSSALSTALGRRPPFQVSFIGLNSSVRILGMSSGARKQSNKFWVGIGTVERRIYQHVCRKECRVSPSCIFSNRPVGDDAIKSFAVGIESNEAISAPDSESLTPELGPDVKADIKDVGGCVGTGSKQRPLSTPGPISYLWVQPGFNCL